MSRSSWKPFFVHPSILNSKMQDDSSSKKEEIVLYNRNTLLTEEMIGLRLFVYNGIRFFFYWSYYRKIRTSYRRIFTDKKKTNRKEKKEIDGTKSTSARFTFRA